jgi:molybdopterin synthase sulfur carrier subunit
MRVLVRLYATLGRNHRVSDPSVPFQVELRQAARLTDLLERLGLTSEAVHIAFVNGRARSTDWQLQDGDEVGLFPPVGGG